MKRKDSTYTVKYHRKRSGKTDYRARRLLLSSRSTRIVIRKTLKYVLVQFLQYSPSSDVVLVSCSSKELVKLGWKFGTKNISAAYLTGLLAGKKAMDKKIKAGVVDLGLQTTSKGGKLFAVVKGLVDAGISINANPKIFPDDKRLAGEHIAEAASKNFKNQFSKHKPQGIVEAVGKLKEKIL